MKTTKRNNKPSTIALIGAVKRGRIPAHESRAAEFARMEKGVSAEEFYAKPIAIRTIVVRQAARVLALVDKIDKARAKRATKNLKTPRGVAFG